MSEQGTQSRRERRRGAPRQSSIRLRRLQLEWLEERTLLAAYTVVDLGTARGIAGINDLGQIAATAQTGGGHQHAVLYSHGTWSDLGTLSGGNDSTAYGINNASQVVGSSQTTLPDGLIEDHAFLYSLGGMSDLGTPDAKKFCCSYAYGINNAGEIVGDSGPGHAYLYSHGTWSDLGTLSGGKDDLSLAQSINDSGQIVGSSTNGGYTDHAFLYSGGAMIDLGTLGGGFSYAWQINNSGEIIGGSRTASGVLDAFLYLPAPAPALGGGTMVDLGAGSAYGINNSGYVVGGASDGHAFLYADGAMKDLNNLIPSHSGWTLEYASAINNVGQIAGIGINPGGQEHVLLLNPGPVPKKVQPDAAHPGGLVVTYQVFQRLPAGVQFPISVYWATGAKGSNALSKKPPHGQAKGPDDALYTYYMVGSSKGPGTYTFTVTPDKLLTAPHAAMDLLVVADPQNTFSGHSYANAILAVPAHLGELSAAQVDKLLPGGGQFAAVLSQTMTKFHIATLEQRAMFMGQLAVESGNLTTWVEDRSRSSCINLYWTQRFKKWAGTGTGASATVNSSGIVFNVPISGNQPPKTKDFDLEWALGSATAQASSASSASATIFDTVVFTKVGNHYTYTFTGAVPPDTGVQFPHLLVVDGGTDKMVLDLVNKLGNWSPDDAFDFRGGGPIQLSGRHNYQLFADHEGTPARNLMTTYDGKSPAQQLGDQNNPQLGFDAAGYFWESLAGNLNRMTDRFAWGLAAPFTLAISTAINGTNPKTGLPNDYQKRLDNYIRIRIDLLDPGL